MNKVIEIGSREGGLALEVYAALSPDIRWSSKVVEMKGFIGPESEIFFRKKSHRENFLPSSTSCRPFDFGRNPAVEGSQFKWKIGLSPALTGSENIFPTICFSENFRTKSFHFHHFRAPADVWAERGTHF